MKYIILILAIIFPYKCFSINEYICTDSITFFFPFDSYVIEKDYLENNLSFSKLDSLMSSINPDSIHIEASSSMEGNILYNRILSKRRADFTKSHILNNYAFFSNKVGVTLLGTNYNKLKSIINDDAYSSKQQIISIIDSKAGNNAKIAKIKAIDKGVTWKYICDNYFKILRYATVYLYRLEKDECSLPANEENVHNTDLDSISCKSSNNVFTDNTDLLSDIPEESFEHCVAVKTNLIADFALISNLGIEIPLSKHYSIDLPLYYSPYTVKSTWRFRVLSIQPEFRYWFNSVFKNHFVGIHLHAGYFNVSYDNKDRFQNSKDNPLWGAGVGYGYLLKLYKHLNIEFNVGVGYANLQYNSYYNVNNGDKYDFSKKNYWGITRLGLSLSYQF